MGNMFIKISRGITFLIFILLFNLIQSKEYYGIKYAEKAMAIEALDPVYSENTWRQLRFADLIHAKLWYRNDKLKKVPGLLKELPSIENGNEYYLELKDNLSWPDGQPLTVDDIIFSIDLYKNCNRFEFKTVAEKISIEKIDDVKFKLMPSKETTVSFYKILLDGIPNLFILPAHIIGLSIDDTYSKKPIGAGLYHIDSIFTKSAQILIDLKKNGYFHQETPPQAIKEVTLVTEPIVQQMISNMTRSNSDSYKAATNEKLGLDLVVEEISTKVGREILSSTPHIEEYPYERNSWTALALNHRKPILQSRDFKIILDEIINDQQIIDDIYGEYARNTTGPFNKSFGFYNDDLKERSVSNPFDIIKKLEKINMVKNESTGVLQWQNTATGKMEDVKLRILYSTRFVKDGSMEAEALLMIKESFENYGIQIVLDGMDHTVFNKKSKEYDYWDIIYKRYTWGFTNSAISYLFQENGPYNITGYYNPTLVGFFDDFIKTSNKQVKESIVNDIHKICYDDLPYIFLWSVKASAYYRNIIKKFSVTPQTFFTSIPNWTIESRPCLDCD